MNKNSNSKAIKQITAIIKKYNNDPKREGDELEILIMTKKESVTLAKFYQEVMKRFDQNDKRWEQQEKLWEQQLAFNKMILKYIKKIVKVNKLKDPSKK